MKIAVAVKNKRIRCVPMHMTALMCRCRVLVENSGGGLLWGRHMRDNDLAASKAEYHCDEERGHGQECESWASKPERAGGSGVTIVESKDTARREVKIAEAMRKLNIRCVPMQMAATWCWMCVAGEFDSEELNMFHRGHWNGLDSCRLGCRLGCHLRCRLAWLPPWHSHAQGHSHA